MRRATNKPRRDTFRWLWFLIFLAGCTGSDEGSGEYEIINTGVESGGACWNDNKRLIVLQTKYLPASHQNEPQGLYYIDVAEPKKLNRIDLSPLTLNDLKQITRIECQDETMLVHMSTREQAISRVYTVKIDQRLELLSEMRGGPVSLKGQYVIGNSRVVNAGVLERHDDCAVRYLKPGFKALCWDIGFEMHWPLSQFVLAEYRWEETIQVRGEDGKPKTIKNPEEPLVNKDGKPKNYDLAVQDLNNQFLFSLQSDPNYGIAETFAFSPDGGYAYTACRKKGQKTGSGADSVCRYRLDGKPNEWEEVFALDEGHSGHIAIGSLNLAPNGDVFFVTGSQKFPGIWKYNSSSGAITQVTSPPAYHIDGVPQVAPDGKRVAFARPHKGRSTLFIAQKLN